MTDRHTETGTLTRRIFIASGALAALQRGQPVFAQSTDIQAAAQTVLQNAASVRKFAIETPLEEINFNIDSFVSQDYQSRQQTFDTLRQADVAQNIEDYLEQLREQMSSIVGVDLTENDISSIRNIVVAIEAEGLPLVPVADSVEPTEIPSIPPQSDVSETDLQVLGDIFAEILGLGEPGLLSSVIQSNPGIEQAFSDLVKHISTKDWQLAAEAIEKILSTSVVADLILALSAKAKRRFLFRLALRAVPFVGWLYTVASIIIAIKSNYHRFSFA